jgi:hypothetical protein
LESERGGFVFSATGFSRDGSTIAALNLLGDLDLWRAPSWEEIAAAEAKEKAEMKRP